MGRHRLGSAEERFPEDTILDLARRSDVSGEKLKLTALCRAANPYRKSQRDRREKTRLQRKNPWWQASHRLHSGDRPPGTIM
ncbi:hypothetical protein R5H32_15110 [Defluviimonas sp. D31]|uniref:hypothetical protein n=1 Tax=Defluviimonas sp. D31 TaxID=3083253 RepID=UPI00296F7AD7|nr:hypothetical protein [Defluviimonas sp. D31]MDW4550689.1 hypothetical protein [Defluviimonas sp. D31]